MADQRMTDAELELAAGPAPTLGDELGAIAQQIEPDPDTPPCWGCGARRGEACAPGCPLRQEAVS